MSTWTKRGALAGWHAAARGATRPRPLPRVFRATASIPSERMFSHSSRAALPQKGSEGRDEINTESNEYSKSGGDAAAASAETPAFTPGLNDPKEQKKKAGEGSDSNPLEVSPANPDISTPPPNAEKGVQSSPGNERERASGGGSPTKHGKVSGSG